MNNFFHYLLLCLNFHELYNAKLQFSPTQAPPKKLLIKVLKFSLDLKEVRLDDERVKSLTKSSFKQREKRIFAFSSEPRSFVELIKCKNHHLKSLLGRRMKGNFLSLLICEMNDNLSIILLIKYP
jgi:hypothetical protein